MYKGRKFIFTVVFFLFLFIFLNFKLTQVPNGMNGDEASIGYNAIFLGDTLRDENNRFLPPFILTLDKRDWKQPVTIYSSVLMFKIFGKSFFALREVSVIYALISSMLLFYLISRLINFRVAFVGTLIFITTPIIVIQSHLALENIAPLPFVLLWLIFLNQYKTSFQKKYLPFAALTLILSFFAYNGMRLVVPTLTLASLLYIIYLNRSRNLNHILYSLVIFLIWYVPLLFLIPFFNTHYSGALLANNTPSLPEFYLEFFSGFLSNFDLNFLYITGDSTPYHSTSKVGMFLIITLPFFLYGILKIVNSKNSFLKFILICFFISPLLFGLTGVIHRASRLLVIVPFYILILTVALDGLSYKKLQNKLWASLVLVLFLLNFATFIYDYWFFYPIRSKETFWSNSHLAFPELKKQVDLYNKKPAIQDGVYLREGIAAKFFEEVYFPNNLVLWNLSKKIDQNFIVLGSINLTNLKSVGFREYPIESTLYSIYRK